MCDSLRSQYNSSCYRRHADRLRVNTMPQQSLSGGEKTIVKDKKYLREETKFVNHMMYIFQAPCVAHQGWPIPEEMRKNVMMYRLGCHKDYDNELASEYETLGYLSSASMSFPLDHNWYRIFGSLFIKFYKDKADQDLKDTFENIELDIMEQQMLTRLRRDIFRSQIKNLKAMMKTEKTVEERKDKLTQDVLQLELI